MTPARNVTFCQRRLTYIQAYILNGGNGKFIVRRGGPYVRDIM